VAEVVDNAIKLLRDQTNRGDIKLINKSMKEIRYALRVFAPYRETRKVRHFRLGAHARRRSGLFAGRGICQRNGLQRLDGDHGRGRGIMAAGHGGAGPDPSFGLAIGCRLKAADECSHRAR